MKSILLFLLLAVNLICGSGKQMGDPTPKERAKHLLEQMTLEEKFAMLRGYQGPYVGNVNAISRLNIPALHLEDGPQGVADGVKQVTCWPSALTVVASWDTTLMYNYAKAMANEQWMKGTNIMLGPMINIARVPVGGRNFESFGEDPHLTSEMAVANVQGIQSQGVIACAKHFVDNNQEYHRTTVSANVGERAQWEIYYPGFQASVDAGVGSIMCSYNRINNTYACENNQTLNVDLKERMGFEGFVMSDWGATHSTVNSANNGLDMQMPDDSYFGAALKQAVQNGQVKESRINDMVYRILVPMFTMGLFDRPNNGNLNVNVQSPQHTKLAKKLAEAGTVLLKNENGLLPLSSSIKSIAVIGDDGNDNPIVAGGGSGHVIPPYIVTPLKGIEARVGNQASVSYANTSSLTKAVQIAKSADVAIVFVSAFSSEGSDRDSLSLSDGQDQLVSAIAKVQSKTIVVYHGPGAILMPWSSLVSSILCAFMPGQEDGNAIAAVLFGDVNPSGKLPMTFPLTENQIPIDTPSQYPGINDEADYTEGLLVGYRWYDAKKVDPLFPFGHGLSYTSFTYSNLLIHQLHNGFDISITVKNSGSRDGNEVVQLYIGYPTSAGEPPKVLRAFKKVPLLSGQTEVVTFSITQKDLSIWDVRTHAWLPVHGSYIAFVGSSSRDIRVSGTFNA